MKHQRYRKRYVRLIDIETLKDAAEEDVRRLAKFIGINQEAKTIEKVIKEIIKGSP